MKKLLALLCCVLMILPALSLAEEEKVLNLLTWETYIDDQTIADFQNETGIRVTYSPMSTNDEMLLKIQQNGGSEYDIILASDYALSILRKEGLLQKLDKSKLANYGNIGEAFKGHYYDENDEYVVPYTAGTPLIIYDPAVVDIEITGYEDLWNPALKDSVVIMDDARNIVGITLKTLGKSFNETDPEVLAQAKEKLMGLYPNIRVFDYDTPYLPLINGEVSVGYMFTSQVNYALSERPDLKVVYPKEGMGFGIDGMVIPVKAPHSENAHIFLDYMMRPEVAARCAEMQGYLNPNDAAEEFLSEAYLNNPVLYIPAEILGDTEIVMDVGQAETMFQEIYTAFKLQ